MKQGGKVALVIVGIIVLATIVYFVVRGRKPKPKYNQDDSNNKTPKPPLNVGGLGAVFGSSQTFEGRSFSKDEVIAMQNYMLRAGDQQTKGYIMTTGGADGVIGSGFKNAYSLMIAQGKVANITDLFNKATQSEPTTAPAKKCDLKRVKSNLQYSGIGVNISSADKITASFIPSNIFKKISHGKCSVHFYSNCRFFIFNEKGNEILRGTYSDGGFYLRSDKGDRVGTSSTIKSLNDILPTI